MNDSKRARVCLQRIVELFKEGNIPKALAVATIPPQKDIPSAKWSWGNKLLQFLADTSDARRFRQWQEAGRKVNKGAKAFHILGPKARTVKETDENGREIEKVIVVGFFAIPVFRAEDTDGEPLPNLTVLDDSGSYDPFWGWYDITGQVRNDHGTRVEDVFLVGTLYDASGTVMDCDYTYIDAFYLDPGQASYFEMTFFWRDYADVASYRLQVDGSRQ